MCSKRAIDRRTDGGWSRRSALWTVAVATGTAVLRRVSPAVLAACLVSAPAALPAAEPAVELTLVDHDALLAAVAAHRGKVVVLDCWSTSCPPCLKEFPGLVALQKRYGEQVVCMSLSFDYEGLDPVEKVLPRVRKVLGDLGAAGVVNMLSSEEADVLYGKLDLTSVPAVYVWKADGALARRFDDDDAAKTLGRPFTYADIEQTVRQLLDE